MNPRATRGWPPPSRRALATIALALAAVLSSAGGASALPDGRAYERVTPADKNGGDVGGPAIDGFLASALGQAALDGNSIGYASLSSFADAVSAELVTNYVSTRSNDGWSTHAISPPAAESPSFAEVSPFRFFAGDLSVSVLEWVSPSLSPLAPPGFASLYLRGSDDSYQPITTVTPPNVPADSYRVTFAGATEDLRHVVFEANDALTPEAPASTGSVYEWTASGLRLVSVLPDGTPAAESRAGDGQGRNYTDTISEDGSRIFWTSGGQLYVREDGTSTTKLNASQRAAPGEDGIATLLATAPDGSIAFFVDSTPLTDAPGDNGGLYEYDVESGDLRNLTPSPGGDPEVLGALGAGVDAAGPTIYFVAQAALVGAATPGAPNLYVARGGEVEFIGALDPGDFGAWSLSLDNHTARVTPDGLHLVFLSTASLTGFDNTDAVSGEPDPQLFLYDRTTRSLTCVSCNPAGNRPIGGASLPLATNRTHLPRVLTDDGSRLLFNSRDALVSKDGNRRQDVYEFVDGQVELISSGTSSDVSALVEVTPDGRDVFFTTRDRLVPADVDNGSDIYDARVGGGFPVAAEPLPCQGEACRGPLAGPISVAPRPATVQPGLRQARPHRRFRCRRPRGSRRAGHSQRNRPRPRCRRGGRR